MIYILAAILIFGVLIALHELGHFCAAKACGVRVNEFACTELNAKPKVKINDRANATASQRDFKPCVI